MARNISYGTSITGNGGINSLAASSTFTVGYQWYVIDNTSTLAIDRLQQGTITPNGTAYNSNIRIYLIGSYDGSTFPDVFNTTPGAKTVTSQGVRDSVCKLAWCWRSPNTSLTNTFPFFFSVAEVFGGIIPPKCVVWVVHNGSAALNSTAGNHTYTDTPIFEVLT